MRNAPELPVLSRTAHHTRFRRSEHYSSIYVWFSSLNMLMQWSLSAQVFATTVVVWRSALMGSVFQFPPLQSPVVLPRAIRV